MIPSQGLNLRISVLIFAVLIVFSNCNFINAQGFHFGRNKVQYTDFDWQVLKTTHFDIYYYPEMRDIAEKGAHFAEESFKYLETKFNYSVTRRIPLIFYSTHMHFQQTNVTPGFIPEGVGGFFEFMKGRVVVPGNGDIKQFRKVIRHELVHVFMHSKVYNVLAMHNQLDGAYPPLWFTEGLAEFWSGGWDARGEMVLKDAVLNNYIVGLEQMYRILGTFTMYKVGQDVMIYIARKYGEDKILLLMENLWKYQRFEECFIDVLGMDYRQFDQKYLYDLKKRYYPMLQDNDFIAQVSSTIVREGYNFKPVYFNNNGEDYVVFVGNRTGYSSIYMRKLEPLEYDEDENVITLVKGEASSDFEAFHVFDSKIDVNDEGLLVFTSKSGETDALYIYDIDKREIVDKYFFKNLVGLISPAWSPDGKEIVFSGLNVAGYKDLYIFNLQDESLIKLTDDFYNDADPSWSPDGQFIAFASDRTGLGREGASNLFLINRNSGEIFYLSYGMQKDQSPVFSADGKQIAYVSDRCGSNNIYIIDEPLKHITGHEPVKMHKITRYIGSAFDPAWTPGGALLFSTYENMRFQIRLDENIAANLAHADTVEESIRTKLIQPWQYAGIADSKVESRKPYIRRYDLDFAQTQVSQDPLFGTTGGAQLAFTDVLGNDQYYVLLYNNARTSGDFLKSFNLAVTKVSLAKRINYATGLFRFAGYYYNPQDAYFYEENVGGYLLLSYPLSHFSRITLHQNLYYSDKDWFFEKQRYAYINSNFISFVHDNSIWGPTGPIDGQRFNVTFGNTYDFAYSNVSYLTGLIDLRKYFRLNRRSAYAVRLLSLFNEGKEIRQFYFGGSWDLRLYRRWSLHGKRIFLLSQELRFPLIDMLGIRMPFFSIGFSGIRGALFLDAGNAWNEEWQGLKGSFGLGIRFRLANVLVLRLDIGRKTDFESIGNSTITQFFFGWDF